MEIVAHRGSSYLAPENTLAAFRLGWEETTTCELDIHLTRDGKLLVIHDDSTQRTTGIDLKVNEHLLGELQELDAGIWKGAQWKGEKLPSLEETLLALPSDKRLFIELKTDPTLVPELARLIRFSGQGKQLVIQSFYPDICHEAKKRLPEIPVYLLVASQKDPETGKWRYPIDDAVSEAVRGEFAGVNPNDTELLTADIVRNIHALGLKLHVWTVDEIEAAKRLINLGVDGLITNRPGWLKAQLAAGLSAS
jgi:glycerophosphoryl diester phosphodiesterase